MSKSGQVGIGGWLLNRYLLLGISTRVLAEIECSTRTNSTRGAVIVQAYKMLKSSLLCYNDTFVGINCFCGETATGHCGLNMMVDQIKDGRLWQFSNISKHGIPTVRRM